MKITTEAQHITAVAKTKIAKVTTDIEQAEKCVKEIVLDAEQSETAKKALKAIIGGLDNANRVRRGLVTIVKTLQYLEPTSVVELNDNECSLLSYVDLD